MELSIVTTMYKSQGFVEEFCRRARLAAAQWTDDFEIILVDDGSPDDSLDVAIRCSESNPHVRVIELSRNFGHHKAIMTGLSCAKGHHVFLIDCDLEESPELLPMFRDELGTKGADVVYGVQKQRKGGWLERVGGRFFYWLFNRIAHCELPADFSTVRLMRRSYVQALLRHRDRAIFLGGLMTIAGFRQVPITFDKGHRPGSTYTPLRRFSLMLEAVTSFSSRPLSWICVLGIAVLVLSTGAGAWVAIRKMSDHHYEAGWPSLIVSIWCVGGLLIFFQGVIGLYLSKVFQEVKRRPYTVVRAEYRSGESL